MRRLLRFPGLHFLLIGGLLFAADALRGSFAETATRGPAALPAIVISGSDVEQLRRGWVAQTGRAPTEEEERALVDKRIDDEILYREALARGLDRGDSVVRNRLVELMRFAADDAEERDDDSLHREAIELGLDRRDVVVRRHLIQMMRLIATQPEKPRAITDPELEALLAREAERYRIPEQVTLTHVFLSESRRGPEGRRDAARLLERLRSGDVDPAAAPSLGDPFPLGERFARASEKDLAKAFGASFAAAAFALESDSWSGPIHSPYGEHLVRIEERVAAHLPTVESVRRRLVHELREKRGEERLRRRLADLRDHYTIRIALAPEPSRPNEARRLEVALPRPGIFLGD